MRSTPVSPSGAVRARIRLCLLLALPPLLAGCGAERRLSLLPATSTGCVEAAVRLPTAARLRLTWRPAQPAAGPGPAALEVWSQGDGEAGERVATLPFDPRARELSATVELGGRTGEIRMLRAIASSPVTWMRAELVGRVRGGGAAADWRIAPRPGAPDVVVYLIDTLRPDVLGAYGGPGPTPALDRLASQGLLFERAYSTSSWTRPAVASLVSGLPVSAHGVKSEAFALPEGVATLAERFRLRGYQTVGVIANGHVVPAFHFDQGFEVYDAPPFADDAGTWDPESLANNAAAGEVHALALRRLAAVRGDWRQRRPRRPLFLYVHVVDPHQPYRPPEWVLPEPRPAVRANNFLLRSINEGEGATPRLLADLALAYRGAVAYADRELGRFLARLAPYADLDRAVLLVASDHGEAFFEHRLVGHRLWLYEELTRVPMILRAPGVPAGRREILPVSLLDVAPTLLGLAGGRPAAAGGGSAGPGLDLLAAGAGSRLARRGVLSEFGAGAALVNGEWKLAYRGDYPEAQRLQLFNLRLDPSESDDRSLAEPAVARRLAAALREEQAEARRLALPPLPVDATRLSPGLLRNLRALGYLK
jgi:arylsulfatase A-like enzyme